jgi:putative peptidoglycan lipid II flippase
MSGELRALSSGGVIRAAVVVVLGFLASGVLGVIRTAAYSANFGAGSELDVFFAAQRIPEMVFTLVAGGALGSAFIPVFARFLGSDDDHAWRLASAVMSWSSISAALIGLVLAVTAPFYMPLLLSNLSPEYQALGADLTRWMLVTTVIFCISGLCMGILNAHQKFLAPALAISMNNVGLIIGAVVIAPLIPTDSGLFAYQTEGVNNIYGLAIGAILGALLHLLVQIPSLIRIRARLRPLLRFDVAGSAEVLRLMLPRMLGLAVTQVNFLVNIYFATSMVEGSNSAMNVAWFLMFFVLGIIAQSVGTAVFPSLAKLAAERDFATFSERLAFAIRSVLFLALPASVGLIVVGNPLVTVLFERGAWTSQATAGTAWALAFFAVGIAGHSLLEVLARAFYALSDTRTPVLVGIASLMVNIVLSVIFIRIIGDPNTLERGPIAGLALANSVTTLVEAGVLWLLLQRRLDKFPTRTLLLGASRAAGAALIMGAVVATSSAILTDQSALIRLLAGAGLGVTAYFVAALILRVPEARSVPQLVLRRFRR